MYRLMGEWVNRLMVKVDECLRVGGWMDGRMVGCVTEYVAWVDGWIDGHIC